MANKFDINAQIKRFDELVETEGFLGAIQQLWNENNFISFHEGVFLYVIALAIFLVTMFATGSIFAGFIRGIMIAVIGNFVLAIYKVMRHV